MATPLLGCIADDVTGGTDLASALVAQGLRERGVTRLVVAGGETSGPVVKAPAIASLRIGAPIALGMSLTLNSSARGDIALALKSGNFGTPDFFERALAVAPCPLARIAHERLYATLRPGQPERLPGGGPGA